MLQRTWEQLRRCGLDQNTVISTSVDQQALIREQIGGEAALVLEPERRDTFPAISLSLAYLRSVRHISEDEMVLVLPVDSQANPDFYEALLQLPQIVQKHGMNLALMAVRPDCPSSEYGYMIPETGVVDGSSYAVIRRFCEKPAKALAEEYIRQGALWNCGIFCFRAGYLLGLLRELGFSGDYEQLREQYRELQAKSFDYAVVERERHIGAYVYQGPWKDMGTWKALAEETVKPRLGPGLIYGNGKEVNIFNELDIPVIALGVSNVVIAASEDGILVTDTAGSSQLKLALAEYAREHPAQDPFVRVIDQSEFADGTRTLTRKVHVPRGMSRTIGFVPEQGGAVRSIVCTWLHGKAEWVINGQRLEAAGTNMFHNGEQADLLAEEPSDYIEIITIDGRIGG